MTSDEGGPAEGYNEILEAAAAQEGLDALVLLQEDVEITDPHWTDGVREAMHSGIDVAGVVGACGGGGLEWWCWPERHGGLHTARGEIRHDTGTRPVDIVDDACIVLSPRAVASLRFDAASFPGEHGYDVDLCLQAAAAGLEVAVVDLDVTRHGDGRSTRGADFRQASTTFQEKWGRSPAPGHPAQPPEPQESVRDSVDARRPAARPSAVSEDPGGSGCPLPAGKAAGTKSSSDAPPAYFRFERPELLALVPETARRVLDVGCASGAFGESLKRARPECEVSGVEYVQDAVNEASTRLDRVARVDLNGEIDLPFPPGYFDTMVFGDVLEHLLDPLATLRRLMSWLAPGGVVVSSVPNVAHWSVVLPMLVEDRWHYTDEGLLDRTHVHLFTLREALALLREAGLSDVQHVGVVTADCSPHDALDPLLEAAAAYGSDAIQTRNRLNSYQYLLVVGRPSGAE